MDSSFVQHVVSSNPTSFRSCVMSELSSCTLCRDYAAVSVLIGANVSGDSVWFTAPLN